MTLYAQGQCLQALQENECMERRNGCSCVTQQDRTNLGDKCCRANCLGEADAVVARVGLCERRELAGCLPVKLTAVYDNAANGCSVAADELGCGMYHDVCAVLNGAYQIRGCERIVYNQRDLVRMRDLCHLLDIYHIGVGVAQCLDENCLSVLFDGFLKSAFLERIYEISGDAVLRQGMCQQIVSTAVNIFSSNDMIAVVCQVLDGVCNGSCTGCNSQCCNAAL